MTLKTKIILDGYQTTRIVFETKKFRIGKCYWSDHSPMYVTHQKNAQTLAEATVRFSKTFEDALRSIGFVRRKKLVQIN